MKKDYIKKSKNIRKYKSKKQKSWKQRVEDK